MFRIDRLFLRLGPFLLPLNEILCRNTFIFFYARRTGHPDRVEQIFHP